MLAYLSLHTFTRQIQHRERIAGCPLSSFQFQTGRAWLE